MGARTGASGPDRLLLNTMRFDFRQESPGAVFTESRTYFFWGLVPTAEVDVLDKCPHGVVAIVDGSGGGMTLAMPTLGLWSRRSTTYYCRQSPSSGTPP